jgi:hypothetical protein
VCGEQGGQPVQVGLEGEDSSECAGQLSLTVTNAQIPNF